MTNIDTDYLSTDIVLARLRARYSGEPVPPCKVCGADLTIAQIGGGEATIYRCSSPEASIIHNGPMGSPTEKVARAHYITSEYIEMNPKDSDVMALLAAYDRIKIVVDAARLPGVHDVVLDTHDVFAALDLARRA